VVCSREVPRVPVGRSRCPMPPFFGAGSKKACDPPAPAAWSDSTEVCAYPKSGCPPRIYIVGQRGKEINMRVLIGIDPHKATNAVAAIDERGELLEYAVFCTNRAGLRSLQRWGKRFPERRWAVEGAGGLGRYLALRLVAAGEMVVDVPAKLSSRARLLATGNARKNDRVDAFHVALAGLRGERLAEVGEGKSTPRY
jgi:hypothetical protein